MGHLCVPIGLRLSRSRFLGRATIMTGLGQDIATPNHELIERWITVHLAGGESASRAEAWEEGAGSLRELRVAEGRRPATKRAGRPASPYMRFDLVRKAGVARVKLKDTNLTRESLIDELGDELGVLLEAGISRIVIDFSAVDKLSYHLAGVLSKVALACRACPGGMLVLCGDCDGLAEMVRMAGLGPVLNLFTAQGDALAYANSGSRRPARLPLPVLACLFDRPDRGGDQASLETMELDLSTLLDDAPSDAPPPADDGPRTGRLVLVEVGTGRMTPLLPRGLTVGREPGCHFELDHAGVSRVHAKCWLDGGQAYIQDLDSRNGTYVQGRRIGPDATRLREGDCICFGSTEVTVARLDGRQFEVAVESAVAGWLADQDAEINADAELSFAAGDDRDDGLPPAEPVALDALPEFIVCERMGDVLVVTPRRDGNIDAALCDGVREALSRAEAAGLPRRVVVSLSFIGQFSGQLVGIILSQHLRLRGSGGEVRICEPQALVHAYLSEIGVDQLLTIYPTLQEAVLDAWAA